MMKKIKALITSGLLVFGLVASIGTTSASASEVETSNLKGPFCVYPCMDM